MSKQKPDQESSGDFINGRPVQVSENGKIRYLDEKDQIKINNKSKGKGKNKTKGQSRSGCILQVIVAAVLGYMALSYVIIPFFSTGGGMADTREVPGDATHFDPIANFAAIKEYAGEGAMLTSFDAYYVRSDGTLDLTATNYNPRVDLEFVVPSGPPADAPPIGAGGAADGKWFIPVDIDIYQPGQGRHVSSSSVSYSYVNQGMDRDTSTATSNEPTVLPDPTCSFADMWVEAFKHDAPETAVATIDYDSEGYRFSISDLSIWLNFDMKCQLVED
jgi:hypothetical protein